ncbi:MAG: Crp/Fnr family transcriptional regulator [Rhodospirillales bacterium]|nr:Crp/Fnr family transcriptional regulator [Rhodospirillales bacterium]
MVRCEDQGLKDDCFVRQYRQTTEWSVLSKDELRRIDEVAVCRIHKVGTDVFREGEPCRGIYYVRNGLVGVRKSDPEGNSVILWRLAFPGNTLGLRPLLAEESHRGGAEVLETSTICFVSVSVIRDVLKNSPALEHRFLQSAARALGDAEEAYFESVTQSVRTRLAHVLSIFKDHSGRTADDGSLVLDLPLTWRNISALIGVRPESMSRVIRKLDDEGWAHFSGRTVYVRDFDGLVGEIGPDRVV